LKGWVYEIRDLDSVDSPYFSWYLDDDNVCYCYGAEGKMLYSEKIE